MITHRSPLSLEGISNVRSGGYPGSPGEVAPRLTVAGQRRTFTGFPLLPKTSGSLGSTALDSVVEQEHSI
jgi:hypothetical protein